MIDWSTHVLTSFISCHFYYILCLFIYSMHFYLCIYFKLIGCHSHNIVCHKKLCLFWSFFLSFFLIKHLMNSIHKQCNNIVAYYLLLLFLTYVDTRIGNTVLRCHNQCWGKLLLKGMQYNIALLPKKVTNSVT